VRIFYGVCADGLGHAMRARVVAEHLRRSGHEVRVATSGRAAALFRRQGFAVVDVRGLEAVYRDGAVQRLSSVTRMVRETPARLRHNGRAALGEARRFAPELVLTDFSGFACALARLVGCPLVSLDHQHVIDRFRHPAAVRSQVGRELRLAERIVAAKTGGCVRYLVTSFYFPALRARTAASTTLVGPILRPEVERLRPSTGEHLVVYQTSPGDPQVLEALQAARGVPVVIFGWLAPGQPRERRGHLDLRPFDEAELLDMLASARAVVSGGGFTTLSEALYLGKRVLSVPLGHQWEQQLNAAWLEELGLGQSSARLTPATLARFLEEIPAEPPRLDPRLRTGTRDALAEIDRVIAEAA
jgi:uncharacterized protein (TIGR00661 family)